MLYLRPYHGPTGPVATDKHTLYSVTALYSVSDTNERSHANDHADAGA